MKKKVSIIVVNWNGKHYLKICLPSLKKLDYPNYEVVVVDNASKDGSQTYVKNYHRWVKLIECKENLGYVGGNNLGIEKTDGEYIFILNNDVEVEPKLLTVLVKRMESDPKIACAQPKLVTHSDPTLLDSVGSFATGTGFLYHYGRLKKAQLPMYNQPMPIYSAKGAAMLLRRKALARVGGAFDPDFFIYFEETDLCHRLWLAGYKVIYEPKAIIRHVVAGDTAKQFAESKTLYLSLRNRICSFLKNLEWINACRIIFSVGAIYTLLFIAYLFTLRWQLCLAILRAVGWNILHFPQTLQKRRFVQSLRRVSDSQLFTNLRKRPHLFYYYYLFQNRLDAYQDAPVVFPA